MPDKKITWQEVQGFFFPTDIACMSQVTSTPALDLGDYQSVKDYIDASEDNKTRILNHLKTGFMPEGGPKWSRRKFKRFKAWVDDGCPES